MVFRASNNPFRRIDIATEVPAAEDVRGRAANVWVNRLVW